MKNMKDYFITGIYKGFGLAAAIIFSFLAVMVLLKFFGFYDRLNFFVNRYGLLNDGHINSDHLPQIKKLLEEGIIFSVDEVFIQTLSYYDILITFLIGILGVVGAIAFFYIKGSSEEKAKEYAKKSTEGYFKTLEFDKTIKDKVDGVFDSGYAESFEGISAKIDKLDKFIKSIEDRLKSLEESNEEIQESNN